MSRSRRTAKLSRSERRRQFASESHVESTAPNAAGRKSYWLLAIALCILVLGLYSLGGKSKPKQSKALADTAGETSSLDRYRAVLSRDPRNDKAHYNLGLLLQSRGKLDEAISHYRQALSVTHDEPRYHNNLAAALAAQGQVDEAIEHFDIALSQQPDNVEACFNLGNALFSKGQKKTAIESYRKVIALRPEHAKAHNNLAVALKETGHLEEAYRHRLEAMRLERAQKSDAE